VRFVFTPPADRAAGLLTLPWSVPLAQWRDDRLVEIRQRGISRHEHRWYMSEAAGRDVGTTAATTDYLEQVLPAAPPPLDETLDDATGPIDVVVDPLGDAAATASGEWISGRLPD
jgi:hypothetical protein